MIMLRCYEAAYLNDREIHASIPAGPTGHAATAVSCRRRSAERHRSLLTSCTCLRARKLSMYEINRSRKSAAAAPPLTVNRIAVILHFSRHRLASEQRPRNSAMEPKPAQTKLDGSGLPWEEPAEHEGPSVTMGHSGELSTEPPVQLLSLHDSLPLVLSFLSPADIRSTELVCLALREATRSSAWCLAAERLIQGTGTLGDNRCVSHRLWKLLCEDAVIAAGRGSDPSSMPSTTTPLPAIGQVWRDAHGREWTVSYVDESSARLMRADQVMPVQVYLKRFGTDLKYVKQGDTPPAAASTASSSLSAPPQRPRSPTRARHQLQRQLLIAAISSSGCDRPEESHRNLLEHSVCDSEPQEGCACHPFSRYALTHGGPLPCYWPSPASPTDNSTHTLDFALCGYVCLVRAIRIQCYSASSHPQKPVFAPRACKVSFGSFATGHARECGDQPSAVVESSGRPVGRRCYVGAAHPCLQQREEQVVAWFEPPLLVVGGHLHLELTGAYQRSTLPSFPDDFYVALTHVVAEGRAVGYLKSAGASVDEGQAATRGDERGVWASTMGGRLSLSDRAARWDRWVDSSAPPSGSAVTAMPPAI